jgi:hypothetical protein
MFHRIALTAIARAALWSVFALATANAVRAQPPLAKPSAADCAWLPAAKLNGLLPAYGPWIWQANGNPEVCMFSGKQVVGAPMTPTISLIPSFADTAAAAAERVKGAKRAFAAMEVRSVPAAQITNRPKTGEEGFSFGAVASDSTDPSLWIGHRGNVVLSVGLHAINTQGSAFVGALTSLVNAGLDGLQGGVACAQAPANHH